MIGRVKKYPQLTLTVAMIVPLPSCLFACENEVVNAISSLSAKIKSVMFGRLVREREDAACGRFAVHTSLPGCQASSR